MKCIKIVIACLLLLSLFSCKTSKQNSKTQFTGLVVRKVRDFDVVTQKYISNPQMNDRYVWYKDSIVLQDLFIHSSVQYENEPSIDSFVKMGYLYHDLRNGWCYKYKTFSDTATLIEKFISNDTAYIYGSWDFLKTQKSIVKTENIKQITDTTINSVLYKRYRSVGVGILDNKEKIDYIHISYVRCDKKQKFFLLDKKFSDSIGCNLVMHENIYPNSRIPSGILQIDFVRDSLTQQELKVFAAWEKYAKEHPLSK